MDKEKKALKESLTPAGIEGLRRAIRELSALNDIAAAINATMSVDKISHAIIERCTRQVSASQGAIFLMNSDEDVCVTFVRSMDKTEAELPIHLNDLLSGWMTIHRKVLLCNDTGSVPELGGADFAAEGVRSLLAVPLLAHGDILGLLVTFNKKDKSGFEENDSRFLSMAGTQVGKVIENAQLYEKEARLVAQIQQQRMAAMANLVAGIAHEMNNPTGAIVSSANVLAKIGDALRHGIEQSGSLDLLSRPEIQKPLEILMDCISAIQSGATRVAATVERLRIFAKLDEADYQKTDIHRCLDDTIALLKSHIGDRVQIRKDYGRIPEIVASSAKLNQLFFNVLMNSIEAMGGGGTITILTASELPHIRVVIRDTGKGIPEEYATKVFDPGFTTKGVRVGVGLGLPISSQIVRSHGGDLRVDSDEGEGTTVTIRLCVDRQGVPKNEV